MFRNYANMNIETLIPHIVETMPIQQVSFSSVQEFLGPDSIGKINKMKVIATELGRERCYMCSYHKAPLQFLQPVKLTGTKDDIGMAKKLPAADFYVPDFVYHPSCKIIQMQGIKTLCKNCYVLHSSMIKTIIMDGKDYTDSTAYRHVLLPLAKERDIETTVLTDILEEKAEQLKALSKAEITWDITYLYNRGLTENRSIYFKPSEEAEGDESITVDPLEAKKQEIKDNARKARASGNSSSKSTNNKTSSSDRSSAKSQALGWLENHISEQNPEYKVYGEIDSGAMNDDYDASFNNDDKLQKITLTEDDVKRNQDNAANYTTTEDDEPLSAVDADTLLRQAAGDGGVSGNEESSELGGGEVKSDERGPIRRGGQSVNNKDKERNESVSASDKDDDNEKPVGPRENQKSGDEYAKPDFRGIPGTRDDDEKS